jgi:DNA-binding ferritin-like protein
MTSCRKTPRQISVFRRIRSRVRWYPGPPAVSGNYVATRVLADSLIAPYEGRTMKTACDCDSPSDNYEESIRVIWHKPSEYNMDRHGPPYLPSSGVKLSSKQKAEVRTFVKKAGLDLHATIRKVMAAEPGITPWTVLMGFLQGLSLLHQTHHWNTNGGDFYGDHLLFERLYNESTGFIDDVAERAVGKSLPSTIDPCLQSRQMAAVISGLRKSLPGASYVKLSLQGEMICLKLIDLVMQQLKDMGQLSSGDSNLLEGIADKHETFVYLLGQRSKSEVLWDQQIQKSASGGYSYDRLR